jgi:small conductance mechanosensitive channel
LAQAQDAGEVAGEVAQKSVSWLEDHGITILIIIGVAVLVTIASRLVVRRFRRKIEGAPSLTQDLNLQRAATLANALTAATTVLIWTIAVLLILGNLDVNLAPLLASAGVAGVALGFGAQSLVKDTLSGFFILMENQFGVGDVVQAQTTAGPVTGAVEHLTLRITSLRAFDGTLHIVPNGNIEVISNKSKGWARAIVDVRVAYGQDMEQVRGILDELFDELREDGELKEALMSGPSVLGVETLADYAQVIRVVADTRPSRRWTMERALRERITRRLTDRGVRVPLPPAVMPGTHAGPEAPTKA